MRKLPAASRLLVSNRAAAAAFTAAVYMQGGPTRAGHKWKSSKPAYGRATGPVWCLALLFDPAIGTHGTNDRHLSDLGK